MQPFARSLVEDPVALRRWALDGRLRQAGAVFLGQEVARRLWRRCAEDLEGAMARQRLWVQSAGPLVPDRLLLRPAPVFEVECVPRGARENALWFRAVSVAFELMLRSRCSDEAIVRTLLQLSREAVVLGRAFPGVATLRWALGAYCGFLAVRQRPVGEFLEWLRGLRGLGWLALPGGGQVYDWEVLARPRGHPLHVERAARGRLVGPGVVAWALPDVGAALSWFERQRHGRAAWLTGAELKVGMLFGGVCGGRSFTLVVSLGPGVTYGLESLTGERGEPLAEPAGAQIEAWVRGRPELFRMAPDRDTN